MEKTSEILTVQETLPKERAFIEWIASQTAGRSINNPAENQVATQAMSQEMADDAYWEADTRRVYSTDMLVDGVHFSREYCSPEDIGWKAAAVNLSDIAGMGCTPLFLLCAIAIPSELDLDWIKRIYTGIFEACQASGTVIRGGDTVGGATLTLNITAIGSCPTGHTPGHRWQAKAGDFILVSGTHGLSSVGLQALEHEWDGFEESKASHLRPAFRLETGLALSQRFERYSLMDTSDGMADAAIKIAHASGTSLHLDLTDHPVHPEIQAFSDKMNQTPQQVMLYGGEDFELFATVPELPDANFLQQYDLKCIGRVEETLPGEHPGGWFFNAGVGKQIPLTLSQTYQHF